MGTFIKTETDVLGKKCKKLFCIFNPLVVTFIVGIKTVCYENKSICSAFGYGTKLLCLILNGVGKVAGIRYIIEKEGFLTEECIAFGDAENDIDMIEFCGIGVAMGNAQEKVKAVADYVTTDIDQDGVKNALQFYGII